MPTDWHTSVGALIEQLEPLIYDRWKQKMVPADMSYRTNDAAWKMLHALFEAGPEGLHRSEITAHWGWKANTDQFHAISTKANSWLAGSGFRLGHDCRYRRWIERHARPRDENIPVLLSGLGVRIPSGNGRVILRHLIDKGARGATLFELVDQLFGHDPDGGPMDAEGCVRVPISRLRSRLAPEFAIVMEGGYYYLIRLDVEEQALAA